MKTTTRCLFPKTPYPFFILFLLGFAFSQRAFASTDTWIGGDPSGATNWMDALDWQADATPSPNDTLVFGGSNVHNSNDFPNGTAFDGIIFPSGASGFNLTGNSVLLSGTLASNFTGVLNNDSGSPQAVGLNLSLDAGLYEFSDFGGGLALNGSLTASSNGVAFFYAGTLTSSSLTNDSTGLIGGLGGQGLMYDGNTPGNPSGLAAMSGTSIAAYSAFTSMGPGAITSGNNYSLTASGTYTDNNATVNTITISQTGNSGGTATVTNTTTGTLTLGQRGGIYALASGGNANLATFTAGSLTAGTAAGATIVFATHASAFGNSPPNVMTVSSKIVDNPGGTVSVVKVGNSSMVINGTNTYSGGTFVAQGQVKVGNTNGLGAGPIYVAPGATVFFNSMGTIVNNIFISPGNGTVLWNGTAANPGALVLFTSDGNAFFNGVLTCLGPAVPSATYPPTPGCRMIGDKDIGDICNFQNQITGPGTLDFCTSPHADYFVLNNNPANHPANNWQGGLIIEEILAAPSSQRNITVQLGFDNQIPSGAEAGNVTMYEADTSSLHSIVLLDLSGHTNTINGLFSSSAGSTVPQITNSATSNALLTIGANNASGTYNGLLEDRGTAAAALNLAKTGTGTETFTSPLTYVGTTAINQGTVALSGSASMANTPLISIAPSAVLDASGISGITLGAAQSLNCTGTVKGNLAINGTIEASNTTLGTFTETSGSMTFNNGGKYVWNINNATGTAGSDPGWSMLNISGQLNLGSLTTGFTIDAVSLSASEVAGNAPANFNPASPYTWNIAYASSGITGFSASQFFINTAGFTGSAGSWTVSVDNTGDYLQLNYNPFQVVVVPVTPATETVNQGNNAIFYVVAHPGYSATFQWDQDGTPLSDGGQSAGGASGNVTIATTGSGSTGITNQLTIAGVDSAVEDADGGPISVTVTEASSPSPSPVESEATLDVIDAPYNLNVSQSQYVAPVYSGAANDLVATASGTEPLSYQWYLNGVAISGATSSSYVINASPATEGSYTVIVSNAAGNATSSSTVLNGPLSVVPNQILFEPFNYPDQTKQVPPWSALGVTNVFNQATGAGVAWVNAAAMDVSTLPAYNMADPYTPPGGSRSLASDEYPVEGLAGNEASTIYLVSDAGGGPVNLPFGAGGTITNGTIYFSLVAEIWGFSPGVDTTPDYMCGLGTGAANSTTHSVGLFILPDEAGGDGAFPNIQYNIGVFKGNITSVSQLNPPGATGNGDWDPNVLLDYTIHLIVCRLNINANGPGFSTCDLWVDPPASSYYTNEANVPTPNVQGAGGTVADQAGGISLFYTKITTYPVDRLFSDVRIGTTWASVTPPSAPTLSLANQVLKSTPSTVVLASQNAGNPVSGSYQWTYNNDSGPTTLSDTGQFSGSQTSALTISGATAANAGTYTVTGSNTDPSPASGDATLTGSASAVLALQAPTLNITANGGNAVLSWPTNWAVALEQTTSLAQPITWTPVTGGESSFLYWPPESGTLTSAPASPITISGGNYTTTVTPGSANLFFQLIPSP